MRTAIVVLLLLLSAGCCQAADAFDSIPQTQLVPAKAVEIQWREVQAVATPIDDASRHAVQVTFAVGNGSSYNGSGVYMGDKFVATAFHVVRGTPGVGVVTFRDGSRIGCKVNGKDPTWDQCILELDQPHPSLPGVEIATANPTIGQRIYSMGFGQGFRIFGGNVVSFAGNGAGPQDWFNHQGAAVQGDSGGPMFDQTGRLIGCLWGTGQGQTIGTKTDRFRLFVKPLLPRLAQWRANRIAGKIAGIASEHDCSTGQCSPSIGGSRPVQAIPDPVPSGGEMQLNSPIVEPGPPGPAGPAGPQGEPGRDGVDGAAGQSVTPEQLGAIAAAITQQLKADPSLRGPRGEKGDRGEPGMSFTPEQLESIKAEVLASINFPDRRVVLVDGSTGEVIDDETYRPGEPIVLDFQRVINAARRR